MPTKNTKTAMLVQIPMLATVCVAALLAGCAGPLSETAATARPSTDSSSEGSSSAGSSSAGAQAGPSTPPKSEPAAKSPNAAPAGTDAEISGPKAMAKLKSGVVMETPRLFKLVVDLSFEEVEITLQAEIGRQNFSVLQTLDVKRGLHNRGIEFPAFRVYQFCTLQHALALFRDNKDFGAFVPCSILLYEEGGKTYVVARKFAADLVRIEGYTPVPEALEAARQIDAQVRKVFDAIVEDAQQR